MKTVNQRNNTALWRMPDYVFTRLFVHIFISLFPSLALLQLENTVRDLQYRVSSTLLSFNARLAHHITVLINKSFGMYVYFAVRTITLLTLELYRFWICVLPAILMAQIEPLFIINRMTFIRGKPF